MAHNKKPSFAFPLLFSLPCVPWVLKSALAAPRSQIRKNAVVLATTLLFSTTLVNVARTQERLPQQDPKAPPGMAAPAQMHHHGAVPLVAPVYPRMGRAQENA